MFDSVEKSQKVLSDWLELNQMAWDYMHDEMKYDDELIDSLGVVTKFFSNRYNDAIKSNDHGNYFFLGDLDSLYEETNND